MSILDIISIGVIALIAGIALVAGIGAVVMKIDEGLFVRQQRRHAAAVALQRAGVFQRAGLESEAAAAYMEYLRNR
jgi:hypothetical protein